MIRRTPLGSALPIAAVPAIGSASLAAPPAGPPTAGWLIVTQWTGSVDGPAYALMRVPIASTARL
jgi:hypothetical protein